MFLDFYGLREQPFGETPDPRFLYLSRTHREALASLFCGVEMGRGLMALVAAPGLGKTTLLFQLLDRLQGTAHTIFLAQTQCNSRELLRTLVDNLGVEGRGRDRPTLLKCLSEALDRELRAGRRCLLVIDEAQNLDEPVLETVRLLSDFETPRAKKLQIVLAGQLQLADRLSAPGLTKLRQRIGILSSLEPFHAEDSKRYIEHRLRVAGCEGALIFSRGALQKIAEASQGIPRCINNLCFCALSLGYALGQKRIDACIVEEAAADLEAKALAHRNEAAGQPPAKSAAPDALYSSGWVARRGFEGRAAASLALAATLGVAGGYAFSSTQWFQRPFSNRATSLTARAEVAPAVPKASAPALELVSAVANPRHEEVTPQPPLHESASNQAVTVVVEPRQTLRQICLHHVGRFNERLVGEIRILNPWMTDPNHLEVGQKVQLPGASKERRESAAGSGAAVAVKGGSTKAHEPIL